MMDSAERRSLAHAVLERSRAERTEVLVHDDAQALTRFNHDVIHQNVASSIVRVAVRAIAGDRIGVASTTALDGASLDAVATRALELAALTRPDPLRAVLPQPSAYAKSANAYATATRDATPDLRARHTSDILRTARDAQVWSAGYVTTSTSGITVANSNGVDASFDQSNAGVNVKMNAPDATGFAEQYVVDASELDAAAVAAVAAKKAIDTRAPRAVDPGDWTVILEPAALGELLAYLTDHFSAQAYHEGSSFLSAGFDTVQLDANVTFVDDATHPLRPGMPFDFEGAPTERVVLVENGAPRNIVTDAYWASRLDRKNTGHALPAPNTGGPEVRHLVVAPGTKPVSQLIAETQRGLLISRFWYIRNVDQRQTIVTGMTRDGTYLIENGALAGGVKNMRFNQNILAALGACEFSNQLKRTGGYAYGLLAPAAKIERFTFSSGTEF